MPALNIIATHELVRNSGCSSSLPSRSLPKRESPRKAAKSRKLSVESTNSQPKFSITQLRTESAVLPRPSVSSTPQRTNATTTAAVG